MPYVVRSRQGLKAVSPETDLEAVAWKQSVLLPAGVVVGRVDVAINIGRGAGIDRYIDLLNSMVPGSSVSRQLRFGEGGRSTVSELLWQVTARTAAHAFPETVLDSSVVQDVYPMVQLGTVAAEQFPVEATNLAHLLLRVPSNRELSTKVIEDFAVPDFAFFRDDSVYVRDQGLVAHLDETATNRPALRRTRKRVRQLMVDGTSVALAQEVLVRHFRQRAAQAHGDLRRRGTGLPGRIRNWVQVPGLSAQHVNLIDDMASWSLSLWPLAQYTHGCVARARGVPDEMERLSADVAKLETDGRSARDDAATLISSAARRLSQAAGGVG